MIDILMSGALVFALDQWSKQMIQLHARDHSVQFGPVGLRCVTNRRSIYARPGVRAGFVAVWLAAVLSAFILLRWGVWFQSHFSLWGLGFALGGAAGKMLDMFRRGGIVDFVDLGWWPVFNLADVAIVAGLLAALGARS